MTDPRAPCIIGVAQAVYRPADGPAPEPLEMWLRVCRDAAADAAASRDVLAEVESVRIVYCQTWPYDDPVGRLAAALGISPAHRFYSGIGGTTPQVLVDDVAHAIIAGDCDLAIVTGAEALDTVRRLKKAGERPQFSYRDPERKPFPFEAPFHPAEVAHEVFQAWLTFPVWDVARRARLGVAPDDYRRSLGELFAPMTSVAAGNPYAWFPLERSAAELATPTADNRMVGYPYTKYLVSVMDVDMAAALVMASHEKADALGVPADRRVYVRGWCYATDPVYVAEHDPLWASPAMTAASTESLRCAGAGVDDVGALGMVSGVGMHLTKHVFALYSTAPGRVAVPDAAGVQATLDARPAKTIRDTYAGPAAVATYTVAHGRDGAAEWGLAVCDLPGGERAYAKVLDPGLLAEMEAIEWVGTEIEMATKEGAVNLVVV